MSTPIFDELQEYYLDDLEGDMKFSETMRDAYRVTEYTAPEHRNECQRLSEEFDNDYKASRAAFVYIAWLTE